MSNLNYSFKQWCIDNNRNDLLERWDYELNKCDPADVAFKSNERYYFKCPKNQHESSSCILYDIPAGKNKTVKCKKCNSFAQFIIDKYNIDYFNDIWNEDNTIDPWNTAAHVKKKGIFNCTKDKSHVYDMSLNHYANGTGCPYCSGHRVIKTNSLGYLSPEVFDIWSDKNDSSPYDYTLNSGIKVWWKCENHIHDDYQRSIANSHSRDFKCPICGMEQSHLREREDITGQTFGELTALHLDENRMQDKGKSYWICQCSCGSIVSVNLTNLKNGNSTTCGDRMAHYSGDKNGNWRGGITQISATIRASNVYQDWRLGVLKKDWYTCQCCGRNRNISFNVHHLYNFATHEELRCDINNGITLCEDCHSMTLPTGFHYIYGAFNNTPEQLEEYINNRRKSLGIDIPFTISDYLDGNILKPNEIAI